MEGYRNQRVPGCGIKGNPHIQSRQKTLKNRWQIVHDMLYWPNSSRFGWDSVNNAVIADNAVWVEYVKLHKKAALFRHIPFPYFDNLCIVWAKDSASGKEAETINDILNDTQEAIEAPDGVDDTQETRPDDEPDIALTDSSSTHASEATS
ncbi:hypothetical protein L6164_004668 [Bauhinia variegata]|uniref:Uncharacterized protein n=1 Tax=Bauhinia variegata TaxID=167791 RepID=A0ACB9PQW5_BAUVA|nr:hypothetical protein L6164_004668 [Bauhinia variegata]